MALTQQQWFEKLQKFVPSWWFENSNHNVAVFQAIAAILAQMQADADSQIASTFLLQATNPALDMMGDERDVERITGESDAAYAARIQALNNTSNLAQIQVLVDAVLHNGSAQIIENWAYGFWDDALFFDTEDSRWLDGTKFYNFFTVITPTQTGGVAADIQAALIAVIEANKALGVTYDVLYQ